MTTDRFKVHALDPAGFPGGYVPTINPATGKVGWAPVASALTHVRERLSAATGNTTLTLGAIPVTGSLVIWINGVLAWEDDEYTFTDANEVSFASGLSGGDVLSIWYQTEDTAPAASVLSGSLSGAFDAAVAEMLADSPWMLLEQQETSGSSLADASGLGHHFAIVGAPTLNAAGPALGVPAVAWPSSVGSEHYAHPGINYSPSVVTVEAWFKIDANPSSETPIFEWVAGYGTANSTDKQLTIGTGGHLKWMVYTGGNQTINSNPVTLGVWHHAAVSVGPAGQKIRLDGVTVATGAATGSYTGAMEPFLRGGYSSHSDGGPISIALPAIYPTQLSDARTDAHRAPIATA